ncbi:M48 family metallopeptidase [Pseudomonas frederiksbergensis]|uniref:Protease HtpX n=1 Tax=Pseudomonas frederiksbergensis TaxID=104087 RepID=A0A6L5C0P6_9PSED|nr:M48 family metallopeptidase [Pseudomonas frederiksbergensis]KAF2394399.1 Protease HtpX [Pseudomonas frederiksbergensis]
MNFFAQQRQAKHRTALLVLLMSLAVLSLITVTSLIFSLDRANDGSDTLVIKWQNFAMPASIIVGVVLLGSLAKYAQLLAGGKVIAEELGGRQIDQGGRTLEEQRLLNIVEEMALASGVTVPTVYLLPDEGINAFAAGFTPKDAVIGVTQGAITLLTREELQGVIAHEFSHIYNGDMRLNMHMVAVVSGLLVLGLMGGLILLKVSQGNQRDNRFKIVGLFIGLILCVAGFAGSLLGSLIKAAVSRQREFLADATAVQYTRNPDSIAGALKKIGGYAQGSHINAKRAGEFSHLFFSPGTSSVMERLFATHPDLSERIRRIDAQWDGTFPMIEAAKMPDTRAARTADHSLL